jgi:hypothetical protein
VHWGHCLSAVAAWLCAALAPQRALYEQAGEGAAGSGAAGSGAAAALCPVPLYPTLPATSTCLRCHHHMAALFQGASMRVGTDVIR